MSVYRFIKGGGGVVSFYTTFVRFGFPGILLFDRRSKRLRQRGVLKLRPCKFGCALRSDAAGVFQHRFCDRNVSGYSGIGVWANERAKEKN